MPLKHSGVWALLTEHEVPVRGWGYSSEQTGDRALAHFPGVTGVGSGFHRCFRASPPPPLPQQLQALGRKSELVRKEVGRWGGQETGGLRGQQKGSASRLGPLPGITLPQASIPHTPSPKNVIPENSSETLRGFPFSCSAHLCHLAGSAEPPPALRALVPAPSSSSPAPQTAW